MDICLQFCSAKGTSFDRTTDTLVDSKSYHYDQQLLNLTPIKNVLFEAEYNQEINHPENILILCDPIYDQHKYFNHNQSLELANIDCIYNVTGYEQSGVEDRLYNKRFPYFDLSGTFIDYIDYRFPSSLLCSISNLKDNNLTQKAIIYEPSQRNIINELFRKSNDGYMCVVGDITNSVNGKYNDHQLNDDYIEQLELMLLVNSFDGNIVIKMCDMKNVFEIVYMVSKMYTSVKIIKPISTSPYVDTFYLIGFTKISDEIVYDDLIDINFINWYNDIISYVYWYVNFFRERLNNVEIERLIDGFKCAIIWNIHNMK